MAASTVQAGVAASTALAGLSNKLAEGEIAREPDKEVADRLAVRAAILGVGTDAQVARAKERLRKLESPSCFCP